MIDFGFGLLIGVLLCVLISVSVKNSGPLDATDNHVTGQRSNMQVLIDHGAGCQYLRGPDGGLTPRLDATGKPMCAANKEGDQ